MPKYELMYLLANHIAETEVPTISQQVLKAITDNEGNIVQETQLGKKKLAYPIKKTRNGFYVVVNFEMAKNKINGFDAKIRSMDSTIIRYLIINQDQHLERMDKDKIEQAKIIRKIPVEKTVKTKTGETTKPTIKLEDIDEKVLDAQIEKALSEDLTK